MPVIDRGPHDVGGMLGGKIDVRGDDYHDWERRVDALVFILIGIRGNKVMSVDELRKNVEALGHQAYDRLSYYERWLAATVNALIQRGVITTEELGRKMSDVEKRRNHHRN